MERKNIWNLYSDEQISELKEINDMVLATTLTGYLAEVNWHLPFLVYLFPFVSVFLTLSLLVI